MGNCKVLSLHKHCLCLFLLFIFFSFHSQLTSSAIPHPQQCHALLQFKSNFVIHASASSDCFESSYPKTESWNENTDCCSSWDGVTCDAESGHVTGLDLSCSQLEGTIHSNSTLFSSHLAPYLHRLNLAGNDFLGSEMSSEFGVKFGSSLTHLNLSYSVFSGNIPSEISHLSNIVSLDLSSYYYSGLRVESDRVLERIAGNLTQLRILSLGGLNMSSIHASSLMNLSSSLNSLSLYDCKLQGQFPASFLLRPNLQELHLGENNLRFINTSLPRLNSTTTPSNNLTLLDLSYNDLSTSIGFLDFVGNHLKSLRHLDLSECNISGSIPQSFGNLIELTHLYLQHNHLSGPIPPSLGNLTNVVVLYLQHNHLSGPIPTSLSNLPYLTDLDIHDNQLSGPIAPSLGNLTNIVTLLLNYNHLNGPIPTSFSNLTHLTHLDMSYNELDGPLPSYLFALPSLESIDLSHNNLHGQIPTSPITSMNLTSLDLSNNNLSGSLDFDVFLTLQKLEYLDLSNNNISSSTSIDTNLSYSLPSFEHLDLSGCKLNQFPTFIKALTNLTYLDVSNNQIQGSIPEWICDAGKDTLYYIDLSGNRLTSVGHQLHWKYILSIDFHSNLLQGPLPIPPTSTTFFSVSDNTLSGEISSLVCNASLLETFDLSHNRISGSMPKCLGSLRRIVMLNLRANNLHGVIPNSFAKDCSLDSLVLNGNQLTGKLPRSLAYCQSLQVLDVGNNMIEGVVPVKILKTLATIDLSRNKFEGHISEVIGELILLKDLNLSHNRLTGHIPSSIGNLNNLECLDLSSNKLSGHIPRELGDLTFLLDLNLSHNQLSGSISQGMLDRFGSDSYEDNLELCGLPLSKACGTSYVASENKDDSNSKRGFSWEGASAGYGCGIVFGLSMGYVVSLEWLVRMVERKKQHERVRKRAKRRAKTTLFMYR